MGTIFKDDKPEVLEEKDFIGNGINGLSSVQTIETKDKNSSLEEVYKKVFNK